MLWEKPGHCITWETLLPPTKDDQNGDQGGRTPRGCAERCPASLWRFLLLSDSYDVLAGQYLCVLQDKTEISLWHLLLDAACARDGDPILFTILPAPQNTSRRNKTVCYVSGCWFVQLTQAEIKSNGVGVKMGMWNEMTCLIQHGGRTIMHLHPAMLKFELCQTRIVCCLNRCKSTNPPSLSCLRWKMGTQNMHSKSLTKSIEKAYIPHPSPKWNIWS